MAESLLVDPRPAYLVFVYGSLKRGFALHHLLSAESFVGVAVTAPRYRLYNIGAYPGLVEAAAGISVSGEVYRVGQECLHRLDAAEGVAEQLYERRPIHLHGPYAGWSAEAWFYLPSVDGFRECDGSWP